MKSPKKSANRVPSISMQIAAKVIEALDSAEGISVEVTGPEIQGMPSDVWLQSVIAEAIRGALQ